MYLIKTDHQLELMKEAGRIVALVHKKLKKMIGPGIILSELDKYAEKLILEEGGIPTFKGFDEFPNSICASVNSAMVHGIPTNYKIKNGDIISIDVGVTKNGWNADAAFTMAIGIISKKTQKLLDVTKKALDSAIEFSKPGITVGELGKHIEKFATDAGFVVARNYVGHGIGKKMHEKPHIPNYGFLGGMILKENMCIAIEPMFIDGEDKLFTDPLDGWTVRTKHGGMTTHYEHTIVVKKNGGEILTKI
ncbi:MAG: type I methionyl aminopeptidase [Mycoplasmataceae bacterium]|nr:type I methionyl aminopeptidase [Mycoplasmataceae bacterium]